MAVDWTKPIELVDGTPCTFSYTDNEGDIAVNIDGIEDGLARIYTTSGKHYYGKLPDIRNVIEPKPTTIDFQLPENRWAAEMACEEIHGQNPNGVVRWRVDECIVGTALYALALRILRTEKPPLSPHLREARSILIAVLGEGAESKILCGYYDHTPGMQAILAALKERG